MRTISVATAIVACCALTVPMVAGTAAASPSAGSVSRRGITGSAPDYAIAANDLGPVPAGRRLSARIYLQGRDPAAAADYAHRVSDPSSPAYGRFLSAAEYQSVFGTSDSARRGVQKWVSQAGLTVTGSAPQSFTVTGTSPQLRAAFGAGIRQYRDGARTALAPDRDLSVPAAVAPDVSAVSGLSLTAAAAPASARSKAMAAIKTYQAGPYVRDAAAATCSDYYGQKTVPSLPAAYGRTVTLAPCAYPPSTLRHAYHAGFAGASGAGRTIAIVDAYGSPSMGADLSRFARTVGDPVPAARQYRQLVDPAQWTVDDRCASPQDWAGEEALDVEAAHGYAPDANILYVGAASCLDDDLMDSEAKIIDSRSADVISNSWAEIVHSSTPHLTPAMTTAWNTLFVQAAIEGIGVYFASGDCGDASVEAAQTGGNCDPATTQAQAEFPASSPWVSAVGATSLATGRAGRYRWEASMGDEVSVLPGGTGPWAPIPGVFAYGGGGGRSDFAQPWYQRGIVPRALAGAAGSARRVTPDVALEGDFAMPVLVGLTTGGQFELAGYGGSSAATPGFAAIEVDAEEKIGHGLGFANPLFYGMAGSDAFHDITASAGSSPGGPPAVVQDFGPDQGDLRYVLYTLGQDAGLSATSGFDSATGLGSPGTGFWSKITTRLGISVR